MKIKNDRFDVKNSERYQNTREFIRLLSSSKYTKALPYILESESLLFHMDVGIDTRELVRPIDMIMLADKPLGVEICIALGADISLPSAYGETIAELAQSSGYKKDTSFMEILEGKRPARPLKEILADAFSYETKLNSIQTTRRKSLTPN